MRITSRANDTIKHIKRLSHSRKYRDECGEFVCDGEKLLCEAYRSGIRIKTVLAAETAVLPELSGCTVYETTRDILESVSALTAPQDVIFTCEKPEVQSAKCKCALLLDRLQDTGNLGTIIRTADAFGIDMLYEDGCADLYNPKTVRAAMGSLFRIPVVSAPLEEIIPSLQKSGHAVYAAVLSDTAVPISTVDITKAAVVIGNEGAGVRLEIAALCDGSVIIPMRGGAESLNAGVAAAIVMYHMSGR